MERVKCNKQTFWSLDLHQCRHLPWFSWKSRRSSIMIRSMLPIYIGPTNIMSLEIILESFVHSSRSALWYVYLLLHSGGLLFEYLWSQRHCRRKQLIWPLCIWSYVRFWMTSRWRNKHMRKLYVFPYEPLPAT